LPTLPDTLSHVEDFVMVNLARSCHRANENL
jgi:hypothetical protein